MNIPALNLKTATKLISETYDFGLSENEIQNHLYLCQIRSLGSSNGANKFVDSDFLVGRYINYVKELREELEDYVNIHTAIPEDNKIFEGIGLDGVDEFWKKYAAGAKNILCGFTKDELDAIIHVPGGTWSLQFGKLEQNENIITVEQMIADDKLIFGRVE